MKPAECRNELAVRGRRGPLLPNERAALSLHLSSCEDCRVAAQLGAAFDGGATLEPDDGMRIALMGITARRWAEARVAPTPPHPRLSRPVRIALIAACWFLVVAMASATVRVWSRRQPAERDHVTLAGPRRDLAHVAVRGDSKVAGLIPERAAVHGGVSSPVLGPRSTTTE